MAYDTKAKQDGNNNANFPEDLLLNRPFVAPVATNGVAELSPAR
jgi:hypothetical protein